MPKSFITEDDIEISILELLEKEEFDYNILKLDASPDKMDILPDGTGRTDKKECVLPIIVWNSLKKINPSVDVQLLKQAYNILIRDYTDTDIVQSNYELYKKITSGLLHLNLPIIHIWLTAVKSLFSGLL